MARVLPPYEGMITTGWPQASPELLDYQNNGVVPSQIVKEQYPRPNLLKLVGFERLRLTDSRALTPGQWRDRLEDESGVALTRHGWLSEVLGVHPNAGWRQHKAIFQSMTQRIGVLSLMPRRDMELETATAEMGQRHLVDFSGQNKRLHMYANEVYVDGELTTSNHFGGVDATIKLGADIGFEGGLAGDWMITSQEPRWHMAAPLRAITGVMIDSIE